MLRKLSDSDKETQRQVVEVRDRIMQEMGVSIPEDLTIDQIEEIASKVREEVPGHKEVLSRDFEAFQTRISREREGRNN